MSAELESSISFLESTNDPVNAYFSFTVDESGEYGVIKANKEGLRLYAAEMLKKSMELEQKQDGKPLFFGDLQWVVSDTGYDLITGIIPQYQPRNKILSARNTSEDRPEAPPKEQSSRGGCLFSTLLWIIGGLALLIVGLRSWTTNFRSVSEAFANLHLWENTH
jgi:hypothetical protein